MSAATSRKASKKTQKDEEAAALERYIDELIEKEVEATARRMFEDTVKVPSAA